MADKPKSEKVTQLPLIVDCQASMRGNPDHYRPGVASTLTAQLESLAVGQMEGTRGGEQPASKPPATGKADGARIAARRDVRFAARGRRLRPAPPSVISHRRV
jgi:hypothetical protein